MGVMNNMPKEQACVNIFCENSEKKDNCQTKPPFCPFVGTKRWQI
jgi:hypothetical protein